MTSKKLFAAIFAALPLACAAQKVQSKVAEAASYPRPAADRQGRVPLGVAVDHAFRLGPGDVLSISVWEEPQLATKALVRPDGCISMPLINDVPVAGLSPEQTQDLLTERLTRVVKHPRVSVVVQEIHSRVVYITGEVEHPGAYPLVDALDVLQLIARSGGVTESAHKHKMFVLRQASGQKVKVDYDHLLKGRSIEQNVALLPGDTVVVP